MGLRSTADSRTTVAALRYFTAYGQCQRPDMLIGRVLDAKLTVRPVRPYRNDDQHRDFTFVTDIVEAMLAAAMAIRPTPSHDAHSFEHCRPDVHPVLARLETGLDGSTRRPVAHSFRRLRPTVTPHESGNRSSRRPNNARRLWTTADRTSPRILPACSPEAGMTGVRRLIQSPDRRRSGL
ncbi:NAD-dependent epimerase/dehydratase family protein [Saccharopolyspora thermophila]|uniref:NAD-dependent epimerase/dehydratase family protein n=1 Tax=Saccharopolyspora thermophila TaxID=89367 RepID=UPI0035711BF8